VDELLDGDEEEQDSDSRMESNVDMTGTNQRRRYVKINAMKAGV